MSGNTGMVKYHTKCMRHNIGKYREYKANKTSIVYAALAEVERKKVYEHGALKRRYQRAMG